MTELKTLKDLGYKEPTNWRKNCRIAWNDFVYIKDLRAEAIKWVREDIEKFGLFKDGTTQIGVNRDGILKVTKAWMQRFNLTEEEIQSHRGGGREMKTKEKKMIVNYFKGKNIKEADELLIETAKNNFKAGYEKAKQDIKEKMEKVLKEELK